MGIEPSHACWKNHCDCVIHVHVTESCVSSSKDNDFILWRIQGEGVVFKGVAPPFDFKKIEKN